MRRLAFLLAVLVLTVLSQIGGAVLILAWLLSRALPLEGRLRGLALLGLFAILYAIATLVVVPPLAALAGRVPLPCRAEPGRPVAAGSPLYCLLNRNYVDPRLGPLLDALAAAMDQAHPGTVTLYLDANFPFLDGMPLAPHLSHDDGRKLDLAFSSMPIPTAPIGRACCGRRSATGPSSSRDRTTRSPAPSCAG
ncbi:hypothetical protein [Inquilinus sp. CA228]|uniref:hypothetical protein n=1 Tax=Inquilinus sp. CA228 TaxID=3455609 RepID=UPI003F8D5F7A